MDLRTPLLRACFYNRSIHILRLTKATPGLFLWLGVLPWSHRAEPGRRPPPQDGPVTFSAKCPHLSLSPAPNRWLCRPRDLSQGWDKIRSQQMCSRCRWVQDGRGSPRPRPPSIPTPPTHTHLLAPSTPLAAGEPCMNLYPDRTPKPRTKILFWRTSWYPAPLRLQMSSLMS